MRFYFVLFLFYLSLFATADATPVKCNSILKVLQNGTKIDPASLDKTPLTVEEFNQLVKGLTKEKLLWFSLEDFAKKQVRHWKGENTKNFLSYIFAVYVQKSEHEIIQVHMPLVSFKDTRSGGFSWHIHIRQHVKENYPLEDSFMFVDKGAVIIEKRGNKFFVEDSHAYPHIELGDGDRKVFGVKNATITLK